MFKLARNQLFPEHRLVFEWIYDKKNDGSWIPWMDVVEKAQTQLAPTVRVSQMCGVDNLYCYRHECFLASVLIVLSLSHCRYKSVQTQSRELNSQ